jgi:hypothetical protein
MGYEDFVWFILSEEDKSSEPSLEYWFKCVDLDCDGVITPNEMQFFYEEQLHRMECMAQEPVLFEDIVCQMADMICPHVRVFMLFYHSSPLGQDGELTDYSECQLACLELLFPSLVIMQKMNGPFYVSYFF